MRSPSNLTSRRALVLGPAAALLLLQACTQRELRGRAVPSKDTRTYLVIEAADAPHCDLHIDGADWPHALGTAGPITPGDHVVSCARDDGIGFHVPAGTTFYFDYWGP